LTIVFFAARFRFQLLAVLRGSETRLCALHHAANLVYEASPLLVTRRTMGSNII
jgi:hypothetical protein